MKCDFTSVCSTGQHGHMAGNKCDYSNYTTSYISSSWADGDNIYIKQYVLKATESDSDIRIYLHYIGFMLFDWELLKL